MNVQMIRRSKRSYDEHQQFRFTLMVNEPSSFIIMTRYPHEKRSTHSKIPAQSRIRFTILSSSSNVYRQHFVDG